MCERSADGVGRQEAAHVLETFQTRQTGAVTNWGEALSRKPHFNPLNLAYLQRRLIAEGAQAA